MRLRTITASDMQEAMRVVRDEIGDDAVIVSTNRNPKGKGITITVAQEDDIDELAPRSGLDGTSSLELGDSIAVPPGAGLRAMPDYILRDIEQIFQFHGVVEPVTQALLNVVQSQSPMRDDSEESLLQLLASALAAAFRFEPLPYLEEGYRYILIGPPGAGKTLNTAKIASQVVKAGKSVVLINVDNKKAGAAEQLAAYAEILGVRLEMADTRAELKSILKNCDRTDRVLIDSAGANPYDFHELKELAEFASLIELEPVLVYPAGSDALEAGEIAQAFSFMGVQRMLTSRLDVAKRFGSLITAAHSASLTFTHASSGEKVLEKFDPMSAERLARLLMDYRAKRL